ncbi:hypothetical protein HPP92_027102 [Vanilla planifolia]|uniref:Uncharacterized protein n=1 Tax=Vanilla planifolia TaxID=51239 RepID=A0A835PCS1_VANPL|nr:hypothetical protein HPP92_027102 [Vanilla planifolia]KAG0449746.1 hypothetical protein HPP92_027193 [Vanilla planifolia]
MDAKALAASKSPARQSAAAGSASTPISPNSESPPEHHKTDKASLLAEVVRHVKELKRQTSEMAEEEPLPTEADEVIVRRERRRWPSRGQRVGLLRRSPPSAAASGNVLVVTGDDCHDERQLVSATQDALKGSWSEPLLPTNLPPRRWRQQEAAHG